MESLRNTHKILMKERTSAIRRGLLDAIDSRARLIAIKGSRGVGKTNFLLDFCKDHYKDNPSCLYVNINNLFFAMEGLFNFVERFYKLGGKVLLLEDYTLNRIWILRNYLTDMNSVEAMQFVKDRLEKTKSNEEFLISMNDK